MKGLLKLAFIGGIGAMLYKSFKGQAVEADDRGPAGSSGIIRDAGPEEQHGVSHRDWDMVDEQSDESFPASDPPGNY